jgi:AAA domain-containing protein
MEIKKAVRHAVNLIVSVSGVSGSGKTYSSILLGAGLAGPNGKVGFIDTENGRGCTYADSPGIMAALPQGYDTIELTAPFTPTRYIEAIGEFEHAGYRVLIIDSGSHSWEGIGGCSDMAEADKGRWNRAKRENKRFVMRLLNSSMHIIVCLRAREKSKIIDKKDSPDGKEHIVPLGILPVAEKNFPYEMMLSFLVDEATHQARPIKLPEQFAALFSTPKMLAKADGDAIRQWNERAPEMDASEKLKRQARAAAQDGMEAYGKFYGSLPPIQKKILADSTHAENKAIATQADADRKADSPRSLADLEAIDKDIFWRTVSSAGCDSESIKTISASEAETLAALIETELSSR